MCIELNYVQVDGQDKKHLSVEDDFKTVNAGKRDHFELCCTEGLTGLPGLKGGLTASLFCSPQGERLTPFLIRKEGWQVTAKFAEQDVVEVTTNLETHLHRTLRRHLCTVTTRIIRHETDHRAGGHERAELATLRVTEDSERITKDPGVLIRGLQEQLSKANLANATAFAEVLSFSLRKITNPNRVYFFQLKPGQTDPLA